MPGFSRKTDIFIDFQRDCAKMLDKGGGAVKAVDRVLLRNAQIAWAIRQGIPPRPAAPVAIGEIESRIARRDEAEPPACSNC